MKLPPSIHPPEQADRDDAESPSEASPKPPWKGQEPPPAERGGRGRSGVAIFALIALLSVLALTLRSASRTVPIRYLFPTGRVLHYRWTVDASTASAGTGGVPHQLHMVLEVRERVLAARPDGGARLRVNLRPVRKIEDGVARGARPPIVLELEVGPTGRVEKILRAADLPQERIVSLELDRLLSESRPPLPPGRVGTAATWPAPLASKGEKTFIDLRGQGRLLGFALDGGRRLAQVEIERSGPVRAEQRVGEDRIQLQGASEISSTADVDVDRGVLVNAVSRGVTTFKLSLEGQPEASELRVVLRSELELVEIGSEAAALRQPR